ncbi:hypothetical protein ACWIID_13980 [Streptomyces phaeochromogenes]
MHGPVHRREYRFAGSKGWIWTAMAAPLAGAAGLTYKMASDEGVPIPVPIAVGAVFTAMFVLLFLAIHATATISDERHLTIRGVFRSRQTPWPEVQAIETELNPQRGSDVAPRHLTVIYDAAGGRYTLPHLNDRSRPDFTRDVEALREVWILRRGDGWTPVPTAAVRIAEARRPSPSRAQPITIAALVALLAFWVGFVVQAIVLMTGVYAYDADHDWIETALHPVAWLVGLPVVAFVITLATVVARHRA